MIEINNLEKAYKKGDKKALNDVSFTIERGIFGLLGHNGAEKTTLMNILTTLLEPTSRKRYAFC
ncbi:hypothetical protein BHF71_10330 [Vulcanibacillus modesticaldus]|uniref:ABC transporter domain-containing protein n=1 Tax=Vulcanibacillus modesticaldus TaxID=337097 RepID=A0A1D2YT06_9BACI|nr:ATP-binding cassette domain-containing protein [Vulcanibacillus modesticaldus]OEF98820.1 hypothetical protein BHF71_10330 [Vulcanibacillus modesticaldus]